MSVISDSDRLIYRYNDGTQDIFADPSVLLREAYERADIDKLHTQIKLPEIGPEEEYAIDRLRLSWASTRNLALIVREVFGIPEFDRLTGKGLVESQVIGLWYDFCKWCNQKKNPPSKPQTSP